VRRALLAALIVAQGCASYNSNYKANKYADEARRLDREGRTIEAGGYWGRAAVKAESLLVRNPNSRYAPGALAIRGEAYAALGQCGQASQALPTAIERLKNTADREQATLALAGCELRLGSPALAAITVQPVTESRDDTRRRQALLLLGTAERQRGRNAEALVALTDLQGSPALVQRTLAHAGGHDSAATTAAFDSLLALRDSTLPWDSLLTISGRADPVLASRLTSALVQSRTIPADRAAALSFADATRLSGVDTVLQRERYEEIIRVSDGTGGYADRARFDMTRMQIRAADSMADLAATLEAMQAIAAVDGSVEGALVPLRRQVEVLQRLMDSTSPGEPQGDMRRFLSAEYARDTLDARPLAARIFESIPQGWPESPYAAKAWLASRQLTGDTASVSGQFAESPYMAVLRGEEGATYAQLEDSLANYARALAAASAPKPARRGAAKRADGTIDPEEEDAPAGVRRRQQRPRSQGTQTTRPSAGATSTIPEE
jgi:tetratricopeptide (TPR) repeat protein